MQHKQSWKTWLFKSNYRFTETKSACFWKQIFNICWLLILFSQHLREREFVLLLKVVKAWHLLDSSGTAIRYQQRDFGTRSSGAVIPTGFSDVPDRSLFRLDSETSGFPFCLEKFVFWLEGQKAGWSCGVGGLRFYLFDILSKNRRHKNIIT